MASGNRSSRTIFAPSDCNVVRPFAADCSSVKPYCGPLRLSDSEKALFDSVATETTQIAGDRIRFYKLDVLGSDVDPLYDEPTRRRFTGPYEINAWVGYANSNPDVPPQGYRNTFATSAWIARAEVERVGMRAPEEGDIIEFWRVPFFAQDSVDTGLVRPGYYFNVVNVSEDGHIFDRAGFVGFTLEIARNTEFTPERRIERL